MYLRSVLVILFLLLALSAPAVGQLRSVTSGRSEPPSANEAIRATPAYAEIVLRRAELESSIEELLVTYKEEFPKVKAARFELGLIEADLAALAGLNDSEAGKLTLALGKLIVRRAQLAAEYRAVSNRYNDEHPATKKAKRKFEIFDRAVKDIL